MNYYHYTATIIRQDIWEETKNNPYFVGDSPSVWINYYRNKSIDFYEKSDQEILMFPVDIVNNNLSIGILSPESTLLTARIQQFCDFLGLITFNSICKRVNYGEMQILALTASYKGFINENDFASLSIAQLQLDAKQKLPVKGLLGYEGQV